MNRLSHLFDFDSWAIEHCSWNLLACCNFCTLHLPFSGSVRVSAWVIAFCHRHLKGFPIVLKNKFKNDCVCIDNIIKFRSSSFIIAYWYFRNEFSCYHIVFKILYKFEHVYIFIHTIYNFDRFVFSYFVYIYVIICILFFIVFLIIFSYYVHIIFNIIRFINQYLLYKIFTYKNRSIRYTH